MVFIFRIKWSATGGATYDPKFTGAKYIRTVEHFGYVL